MTEQTKTRTTKQSFRELQIWRKSMELTVVIYRLTKAFPREESFGLTAQLRRSAISIPSNIAEGHGRMNPREFRRFLLIARGSNCELQTQLELATALQFADVQSLKSAQSLSYEVENMLFALLSRLRNNST
ncbi:MAG: four helix bundle protein [Terracidiphilus sp.]|jgi:four helix bundle protein